MTKIALITGASRGLGRNTALNIAREGSDVIITYHSREESARAAVAEIVAMGRRAIALQLDVGDVSAFKPFAEHLRTGLRKTWQRDTFDHLVNNAGHGESKSLAEDHSQHVRRLRSEGETNSKLIPAIRDVQRHHAVNPGQRQQQRSRGKTNEQ